MIRLMVDILIYRITPFKSFNLFLNVNDKSLIYNVVSSLYMDIFVIGSRGFITGYILIWYMVRKLVKWNYNKFIYYYIYNMLGIIGFFLLIKDYKYLLNILVINSILIVVSYIIRNKRIKLF